MGPAGPTVSDPRFLEKILAKNVRIQNAVTPARWAAWVQSPMNVPPNVGRDRYGLPEFDDSGGLRNLRRQ
jgi:hypothetical protein